MKGSMEPAFLQHGYLAHDLLNKCLIISMKHMKHLLPFVLSFGCFPFTYGQLPVNPATGGQVVRSVKGMGREIQSAKEAQDQKREREEQEYRYSDLLMRADTLFAHRSWIESIQLYEQALQIREAQYPRLRIAEATAQLNRQNGDVYQRAVDTGDSLFGLMEYNAAIDQFNAALAIRWEEYPQNRIKQSTAEVKRCKKVHFSGLPISDILVDEQTSRALSDDPWSDFLDTGSYAWIDHALTFSNFAEVDGLAIPEGIHVTVYAERNFKGAILLDVTGPAIIGNATHPETKKMLSKPFEIPVLQKTFPTTVRRESDSDMHKWINGSIVIRQTP